MVKPRVKVLIVNRSRDEKCGGECGLDWSQAAVRSQAQNQLQLRYGDRVSLEYLDLDQQPAPKPPQQIESAVLGSSVFPVLLVNDQPRIWGDFDLRMLRDMIDAEMEVAHDQGL